MTIDRVTASNLQNSRLNVLSQLLCPPLHQDLFNLFTVTEVLQIEEIKPTELKSNLSAIEKLF